MKKKIISLLLVLALCLGMTFSVSAEDAEGFANDYCRVQDMAGLMTDSEEAKLNDTEYPTENGCCRCDNKYAG